MENKRLKLDEHEERRFTNLPVEITEKIFDYLTPMELLTVSQVCRQYFEVTQSPTLGRKIRLKILFNYKTQREHEHVLGKSERKFFHLYMKGYNPGYIPLCTMSHIYSNIESIVLTNFSIPYENIFQILQYTKNLRSLTLTDCGIRMGERVRSKLEKSKRTYRDDLYLENISEVMANLTDIKFDYCITVKSWDWLLKMINLTSNLKKLNLDFSHSNPNSTYTSEQISMQEKVFGAFMAKNQETLKVLEIGIHDSSMIDFNLLAENMKQLVKLKIYGFKCNVSSLNLLTISKFKKLEVLEFQFRVSVQISLIREVAINFVLRELHLVGGEITNTDILCISEYCPNLELLKCFKIPLADDGLQAIIKKLSKLKYLDLCNVEGFKVTDFGISGFNCETNEQTGVSIKQLENLECLSLRGNVDFSENCLIDNLKFSKIKDIYISVIDPSGIKNLEQVKKIVLGNCPKIDFTNNIHGSLYGHNMF